MKIMAGDVVKIELPADCRYGFSREAVEQIVAEDIAAFDEWMRGQTQAICDGREYDYDAREYVQTDCGPHGVVTYPGDLERFLRRPTR